MPQLPKTSGARLKVVALAIATLAAIAVGTFVIYSRTESLPLIATAGSNASAAAEAQLVRESAAVADQAKVTSFLGDSYTAGSAADTKALRWSTLVTHDLGWHEKNYGVGGTGYANRNEAESRFAYYERVLDVVAGNPGTIVVSGGRTDVGRWRASPEVTLAKINETFTGLRAAAPLARIVAVNPWWDDEPAPAELQPLSEAIQVGVIAVGGEFLDTGQPLYAHPELIAADGYHPNTQGHAALAVAVEAAMGAGR